jgi:hypothetical protein
LNLLLKLDCIRSRFFGELIQPSLTKWFSLLVQRFHKIQISNYSQLTRVCYILICTNFQSLQINFRPQIPSFFQNDLLQVTHPRLHKSRFNKFIKRL